MQRSLTLIAMIALCDIATAQTSVRSVGLSGVDIRDVSVAATSPAVAYAATEVGIFKTVNRGQSWTTVRDGITDRIALGATDAKTAYASSINAFETVKTTDGGATWTRITPDIASVLAVVPSDPASLYAALYDGGMSKSSDGGRTWSTIMNGLPHDFFYGYSSSGWEADSIAVDPASASTVYVGKPQGLFKTTDGGINWRQLVTIPAASSIVVDAANPSVVYAASGVFGVWRSNDEGMTWTLAGLPNEHVLALTISATSPAVLYAGTYEGEVYRSTNGGDDWSIVDSLNGIAVRRMSIDASGTFLYAATNYGVYRYQFFNDNAAVAPLPGDPLRLPRLLPNASESAAFVLPVVGTATGVGGLFSTEVTLTNQRDRQQDVVLAWLPEVPGANGSSFRMTLPAASSVNIADLGARLGVSGIGSLAVFAIGARDDNFDASASIDGSARIWDYPADGGAPLSQMIPAVRSTLFSNHTRGVAADLQQDADFRTNAGIVNLSADMHQFTIQIDGSHASGQLTIAVPPFSLVQVPIAAADGYGHLDLAVFADAPSRWIFYGSTINNSTQEAHTTIGAPGDN
jgi:photosystem II stability/assembly factor-like uncharacterized protein